MSYTGCKISKFSDGLLTPYHKIYLILVHYDIWSLAHVSSYTDFHYYVVFIDEYSCFTRVNFRKQRYYVLRYYNTFTTMFHTWLQDLSI